ncbi:MAG: hypothetical protein V7K58_09465 [Nostoc sp.]
MTILADLQFATAKCHVRTFIESGGKLNSLEWVERDSRPAALVICHWSLVLMTKNFIPLWVEFFIGCIFYSLEVPNEKKTGEINL